MTADPATNGKKKFNFNFGLGKKDDGSQANAQITVQEHVAGDPASAQNDSSQVTMAPSQQQSQQDNGIQVTEDNLVKEPVIQSVPADSGDNPFAAIVENAEVETEISQPIETTQTIEAQAEETTSEDNPFGAVAQSPEVETEGISEFSATEPQFKSQEESTTFEDTTVASAGDNPFATVVTDDSIETVEESLQESINPFTESKTETPEAVEEESFSPQAGQSSNPFADISAVSESANEPETDLNLTPQEVPVASSNPFANPSINDSEKSAEEMNAPIGSNPFAATDPEENATDDSDNPFHSNTAFLENSEAKEATEVSSNPFAAAEPNEETSEEAPAFNAFATESTEDQPTAKTPSDSPFASLEATEPEEAVAPAVEETQASADPFAAGDFSTAETQNTPEETVVAETKTSSNPFAAVESTDSDDTLAVATEETTSESPFAAVEPSVETTEEASDPFAALANESNEDQPTEEDSSDSPFASLEATESEEAMAPAVEETQASADPFAATEPSVETTEEVPAFSAFTSPEASTSPLLKDEAEDTTEEAFAVAEAQIETEDSATSDNSSTTVATNDDPLQTLSSVQAEITNFVKAHKGRVADLEQQIIDVKKASHDKITDLKSKIKAEEDLLKNKQTEFKKLIQEMEKLTTSFDQAESQEAPKDAPTPPSSSKKKRSRSKKKKTGETSQ